MERVIEEDNCGKKFDEIGIGEMFLYDDGMAGGFFAWKVCDTVAVFANREGRFIRAKRYANCLSIGTYSKEYDTFSAAADVTDDWRESHI